MTRRRDVAPVDAAEFALWMWTSAAFFAVVGVGMLWTGTLWAMPGVFTITQVFTVVGVCLLVGAGVHFSTRRVSR
jgi:hypothetical protein